VTISSSQGIEAGATVNSRHINSYSPYGFESTPPVGEEVIIIPSSDGQVALGTKNAPSSLKSGEVRLSSVGGASIVLKNDGTIAINSLVIDKNGVVKN
jgi:phage gp45-like